MTDDGYHEISALRAQLAEVTSERDAAIDLAIRYGQIDGAHHKTWVIDQVLRLLLGNKYEATIKASNAGDDGPETYTWDTGTPP